MNNHDSTCTDFLKVIFRTSDTKIDRVLTLFSRLHKLFGEEPYFKALSEISDLVIELDEDESIINTFGYFALGAATEHFFESKSPHENYYDYLIDLDYSGKNPPLTWEDLGDYFEHRDLPKEKKRTFVKKINAYLK